MSRGKLKLKWLRVKIFYMSIDRGVESPYFGKDNFRLNPTKSEMEKQIETAKGNKAKVIFEIGPGESLGIEVKKKDVYIGMEPYSRSKKLNDKINKAHPMSTVNLVEQVYTLPDFEADLVLAVAPNPNDIEDGMLFDYEPWLRRAEGIVLALDTRTIEANTGSGVKGLVKKIQSDFREMGIRDFNVARVSGTSISRLVEEVGMEGYRCSLESSADIGSEAVVIYSGKF